jgi:hypothetical protein
MVEFCRGKPNEQNHLVYGGNKLNFSQANNLGL